MTPPIIDRGAAKANTRLAAGAGAVLLACGAALGVLGLPVSRVEPVPDVLTLPPPPPRTEPGETRIEAALDIEAASARMRALGNSPRAPAAPGSPTPETPGASAAAPPPPPPPAEARYIANIAVGSRLLAVLVDGERQRIVKAGDTLLGGGKIVRVEPDKLVVEDGAGRRTIPMAERTGEVLSRAAPAPAPGPAPMAIKNLPRPTAPGAAKGTSLAGVLGGSPVPSRTPGPTKRVRGTPDNSPERLDEIFSEIKASGRFKGENEIWDAAKQQFEQEAAESEERQQQSGGAR
ncbi:MAG: hypothetical protein SFY69_02275 [Planctomycetota bacterium]|nr:hypothetical protein [Planctomycetota bacterium]